jgi:hypothetical protein
VDDISDQSVMLAGLETLVCFFLIGAILEFFQRPEWDFIFLSLGMDVQSRGHAGDGNFETFALTFA